ncbi:aromatic ring-hydroxylating oxygenase subunit alpha [Bordetella hinzii]|uniref:Ring-hydroxylating oxygenase subunit alpha n=1 Tax=Bordetella hinzii TaxID=103855 RepID=A0AAN1RVZ9_9BORD|nr:SRPBCC family protein [Bordetella hinzii]AKQ61959.1 Benzene 1,2-dioxygenase subunit alpha [Bordetella hinzii]AZW17116.1 ring-hydroxylating oxygenase subunit alpha [Bordetella hinzii]MBZ0074873.1 Rieske 2Fe-2S domain-containing protein [Bordetella hinzii]MBZ0079467.1 Rieske 2Fe-2S domain-containing protein [Bordetella hinzii]MBZ0084318.1 Rieske 2Fe-2S domain-containing protein [Bordetella hinzii]
MKEAVFDPDWYADERYARLEQSRLFEKLWLTAGFLSALKKDGDYFTVAFFGREVVIHLLNGTVRAYFNLCPHRGGAIVTDIAGNTRPVCKYHGWAFREGAALTGLRMAHEFEHDPQRVDDACGRGLTPLAVKVVGPVIFINMDEAPLPIEAQFPPEVLARLERAGKTSTVLHADFDAHYNWKLNMENVKDYMHIYFVHPSTFLDVLPVADASLEADPVTRVKASGRERFARFEEGAPDVRQLSYLVKGLLRTERQWYDDKIKRKLSAYHYENIFLFPNTNFCSVAGRYYMMQQYLPVDAGRFRYRVNLALVEMREKFDVVPTLLSIARAERYVIDEDSVVLERVQRGMASLRGRRWRFTQGDYEVNLMRQMTWLKERVYGE